jgi:hypothetical protein
MSTHAHRAARRASRAAHSLPPRDPVEALLAEIMARVTDEEIRGPQLRLGEATDWIEELAIDLGYMVYDPSTTKAALREKCTALAVAAIRFARDVCGETAE